jgi:hypothetical protein
MYRVEAKAIETCPFGIKPNIVIKSSKDINDSSKEIDDSLKERNDSLRPSPKIKKPL